jgi:hypothetical protein
LQNCPTGKSVQLTRLRRASLAGACIRKPIIQASDAARSALRSEAGMGGALGHGRFGPIGDIADLA